MPAFDVVLWNCVINLSPDKPLVFREAHRVLRPGGRLAVSDLVLEKPLPPALLDAVRRAGFPDVRAVSEASYGSVIDVQTPEIRAAAERVGVGEEALRRAVGAVTSVKIAARRRNGA